MPSFRSARTSPCWRASRGSSRSGSTSHSGGSARAVEPLRVDDYWPTTGARATASSRRWRPRRRPPTHPPRPTRTRSTTASLPLGGRVRRPAARRRSPQHRRRHRRAARRALTGRGRRRRSRRSATSPCRSIRARRTSAPGALAAGPRAGSYPAGGPADAASFSSSCRPAAGRGDRARARAGLAAAALAGRPVLRHRGRPVRLRCRPRLPVRDPRRRAATFNAIWSRDVERRVLARRRESGIRAAHRPDHGPPRRSTRRCTSTTTRRTSRPPSSD